MKETLLREPEDHRERRQRLHRIVEAAANSENAHVTVAAAKMAAAMAKTSRVEGEAR